MCITLLLALCKSNTFVAVFRNPWVSKNKIVVTKNTFVALFLETHHTFVACF